MKLLFRMACFLLLGLVLYGAEINVCPSCGHEYGAEARFCGHCGARIVAEAGETVKKEAGGTVVTESEDVELSGENADLLAALLEDLREGDAAWQAGRGDIAYFFWRNALGLAQITTGKKVGEIAAQLPEKLLNASRAGRNVRQICTSCDGSGKRFMESRGLSGSATRREVPGSVCPECSGSGYVMRRATPSERKRARAEAQREYNSIQQGRLRRRLGEAWVPDSVADKLDVRGIALLKTTVPAPCRKCQGIGADDCRECNGTGSVPCSNRECEDGWIEVESGGQLSGKPIVSRRRCPVCQGAGRLACQRCGGSGGTLCNACDGSGQRPLCRRCDGAGFAQCGRCSGSGVYRGETCGTCGGEGIVLCRGCQGDGRSR